MRGEPADLRRGTLGKFASVESDISGAIASSLIIIRPESSICPSYLKSYLGSKLCEEQIDLYRNGAAQPNLAASSLKKFKIPLPPLDEQRRIAAILDKADALRRKRKRALDLLDSLGQSIFLEMFGSLSSNSHRWASVNITDACELIVDCVNRTAPVVDYPTPYKMLRTTNVRNGRVDVDNVRFVTKETFDRWNRRATPRSGDVLLTRSTGRRGGCACDR
jgi:type I restriction enzyme S subunit